MRPRISVLGVRTKPASSTKCAGGSVCICCDGVINYLLAKSLLLRVFNRAAIQPLLLLNHSPVCFPFSNNICSRTEVVEHPCAPLTYRDIAGSIVFHYIIIRSFYPPRRRPPSAYVQSKTLSRVCLIIRN